MFALFFDIFLTKQSIDIDLDLCINSMINDPISSLQSENIYNISLTEPKLCESIIDSCLFTLTGTRTNYFHAVQIFLSYGQIRLSQKQRTTTFLCCSQK